VIADRERDALERAARPANRAQVTVGTLDADALSSTRDARRATRML